MVCLPSTPAGVHICQSNKYQLVAAYPSTSFKVWDALVLLPVPEPADQDFNQS